MGKSAYIKLVAESVKTDVTLEEVKEKLQHYINMTTKTGQQLDWTYAQAAFPYTIEVKPEAEGKWFYLKGINPKLYKYIIVGVGSETIEAEKGAEEGSEEASEEGSKEVPVQHYIQVVLPEGATHGDSNKANEFSKYLAKEYKAQLQLFNGRVMYYYPRKP